VGGVAGEFIEGGAARAAGANVDNVGRSGERSVAGAGEAKSQVPRVNVSFDIRCAAELNVERVGLLIDAMDCAFGCAGEGEGG